MGWMIFAAEGPNSFFLPGDIKEFWWSAAAFTIVFALFLWKGLPFFKQMLNNRTQRIEDQLAAASKAQADADARIAEQQAKFANQDAEARQIVQDSHVQAEKLRVDLRTRMEAELVALRAKSETEVRALGAQAGADVQAELSTRTLAAAEALVAANLDDKALQDLIEQYITDVGASS